MSNVYELMYQKDHDNSIWYYNVLCILHDLRKQNGLCSIIEMQCCKKGLSQIVICFPSLFKFTNTWTKQKKLYVWLR